MPRLAVLFVLASAAFSQPFDILIAGGKVVDGTGNPWRMADVGIRGGRIVEVGQLKGRAASRTIDASGLIVAPGFIDIHNHSDNSVVTDGNAESMIRQGVTSMIFGEGGSAAPVGGKQGGRAETRWKDFAGYFSLLMKQGISPNVGTYVGSSDVWTFVRGPQAGPPTADEVKQMRDVVRQAMEQGALGVASSLSGPPGSWIDTETLIEMCKVASEYGGIYSTHMRTEGQGVFESVAEALKIGREAKVPVDIIHLKIADHKLWGRMPELIATIQQARMNGQQVEAHVYPYRAGQNNLATIVPPWAHEGGTKAMLARLQDPTLRARIKQEIQNGIPGSNWYNHYTATGSWEGMLLVSLSNPEYKKFEGKRMNEVLQTIGGDPFDGFFKLLQDNSGSIPTIYFHHNEDDMRYALQQPFVSIGSDGTAVKTEGPLARGNPHPRYYGTFPRVLGRYVRDEKVITLEEAVRKMTSANAAKIGIYDRGVLRSGLWADVAIFNPETVLDLSIWDKPHQYAKGIEYVVVNGQVVLAKGDHTNARPGKILFGAGKKELQTAEAPAATPVADERSIAEWVIRSGGTVRLDGGPAIHSELASLPTKEFRIVAVDLVGTTVDPKELKRLGGLSELRELFLPGTIFNPGAGSRLDANEEFKALAGLRKLERLHFSLHFLTNVNVQDKGLAHLKDLPGLRELRLTQGRIKGQGLAPFTKLEKLDLNYSTFADEGMQYIAGMKDLTHLSLRDTLVTDVGVKNLAGLTNLTVLDLYGARLTDEGLKSLAGLKKLEKLNLLGASVTDDGADILATLPALQELNLYRSQISNSGLTKLAKLKNLQSVDLRYTRVTRGGVDDLRRALPAAEIIFLDSAPQTASAALRQSRPAAPTEQAIADWVMKLGGRAAIREGTVREIDLSRTPVSDSQIEHLKPLRALESLNLETTEVGDLGASTVAEIKTLRNLNLSHTMLSDKALPALGKLANLETLLVHHTLIDGSGLGSLAGIASLRQISLAGCAIEDKGAVELGRLTTLRDLDLSYSDVSDKGFAALKGLTALERLDLTASELGDDGIQILAGLTNLKELLISYSRHTDKGMEALRGLKQLEVLETARTRISDAAIPVIASLSNLRRLNLDYTNISDKSLGQLASGLPNLERLSLDTANLTDAAVASLERMKSLKELNLYHTLITDAAVEKLKAALPQSRIVYDRESALPTRRKS